MIAVQISCLTGAGEQDCKLCIVPVKVKSKKGNVIVEPYALELWTMAQEKFVECSIVSDLEVAGLDGGVYCDLPGTYTQQRIPVSRSNIPRQQYLSKWPYLHEVHLPEIELFIGFNVPRAQEPSQDGGPYAVQTVLGWTVNGPLSGGSDCEQSSVTANRISVVSLVELRKQQFHIDFPECSYE